MKILISMLSMLSMLSMPVAPALAMNLEMNKKINDNNKRVLYPRVPENSPIELKICEPSKGCKTIKSNMLEFNLRVNDSFPKRAGCFNLRRKGGVECEMIYAVDTKKRR